MATARKVAKNTTVLVIGNIAVKIIVIIVTVFLARYLGVADFGKYTFIITFLMFFGFISVFGLDSVIIREISRDPSKTFKMMNNAFVIRLITSFVAIVLAILTIHLMNYPTDITIYITIMSTILLFQGLSYLLESLFYSRLKMEYSVISIVLSKSVFAGLTFYIIFSNGTLFQIFIIYILSEAVRLIVVFFYSRKFTKLHIQIDLDLWKYLIKEALPFVVTYGFYIIFYRVDILMISAIKSDTATGLYSAAYKLTDPWLFLPGALASSLMPIMSKQYVEKAEALKKTYITGARYIFILMLPITVGIYILSEKIIHMLYGSNFSGSIFALQILAGTILFNSLHSIQSSILSSTNKQKLTSFAVGICAIINISLNYLLIPQYSYIGASFATLISVIILFLIEAYFIYVYLSLQPFNKNTIKPFIASFAMGILLTYMIKVNIIYLIGAGAIIYLFIIISFKGLTKEDIKQLKK